MTNSTMQDLSTETAFAIYHQVQEITEQLRTVRWQLIRPIGPDFDRQYLRDQLADCIMQAQIALDNLN